MLKPAVARLLRRLANRLDPLPTDWLPSPAWWLYTPTTGTITSASGNPVPYWRRQS